MRHCEAVMDSVRIHNASRDASSPLIIFKGVESELNSRNVYVFLEFAKDGLRLPVYSSLLRRILPPMTPLLPHRNFPKATRPLTPVLKHNTGIPTLVFPSPPDDDTRCYQTMRSVFAEDGPPFSSEYSDFDLIETTILEYLDGDNYHILYAIPAEDHPYIQENMQALQTLVSSYHAPLLSIDGDSVNTRDNVSILVEESTALRLIPKLAELEDTYYYKAFLSDGSHLTNLPFTESSIDYHIHRTSLGRAVSLSDPCAYKYIMDPIGTIYKDNNDDECYCNAIKAFAGVTVLTLVRKEWGIASEKERCVNILLSTFRSLE